MPAIRNMFTQNLWQLRADAYHPAQLPARSPHDCDVAFFGRANVGKSTLINKILNRKKLAVTSKTPGCTRKLVFYQSDNPKIHITLVDTPGYGYSRLAQHRSDALSKLGYHYLQSQKRLQRIFVLIDARHGPKEQDHALMHYLNHQHYDWLAVMTKSDALATGLQAQRIDALKPYTDRVIFVSAKTGLGIAQIRKHISQCQT